MAATTIITLPCGARVRPLVPVRRLVRQAINVAGFRDETWNDFLRYSALGAVVFAQLKDDFWMEYVVRPTLPSPGVPPAQPLLR